MAYVLTMKKSGMRMTYVAPTPEAAIAKALQFRRQGIRVEVVDQGSGARVEDSDLEALVVSRGFGGEVHEGAPQNPHDLKLG
jgi:hypothetical protein